MHFETEVRRCKRCAGLVAVPLRYMHPETGVWHEQSRRGRCRNEVRVADADWGELCGSQALAPIAEDEPQTMPCQACGGTMEFTMTAIAD